MTNREKRELHDSDWDTIEGCRSCENCSSALEKKSIYNVLSNMNTDHSIEHIGRAMFKRTVKKP